MNAMTEPTHFDRLSNQHLDALEEETIFILREVSSAPKRLLAAKSPAVASPTHC